MDDLTAQERELIMTFRRLSRVTAIVHPASAAPLSSTTKPE
jgi:hypothetical protein